MNNSESIEGFYKRNLVSIPNEANREIGHFNVFKLEPFLGDNAKPIPYQRRDYYKITLMIGPNRINYADKVIDIQKQALFFSNPQIPYTCSAEGYCPTGFFCVFNQSFFYPHGSLNNYEVFQPHGNRVFNLSDEQVDYTKKIYERMFDELNSDYIHKYEILRNLVSELLHFAMKTQPAMNLNNSKINANQRISVLFMELLERQFPIDENHREIRLRSASDYAEQLNVHVNHLNRAIKETTNQTTTQLIAERILMESKVLLKHSTFNVSEIAYSLGFKEVTHFNNFFKQKLNISPVQFRNV